MDVNKRLLSAESKLLLQAFRAGSKFYFKDAAAYLGISPRNARAHLNVLKAAGHLRVFRWIKQQRGPATPLYCIKFDEDEEDAVYPAALTEAEQKRNYRSRMKCQTQLQL